MNRETTVGASLLMASGGCFYLALDAPLIGSVLLTVGAWAMVLPRVLGSVETPSW